MSARLRQPLGYAAFLVALAGIVLAGVFVVFWYVPSLPLRIANFRASGASISSRQELLDAVIRVSGTTLLVLAAIGVIGLRRKVSARLRLALSYAAFLVAAGGVTLLGVYVVLRYVPDYPLTPVEPPAPGPSVEVRPDLLSPDDPLAPAPLPQASGASVATRQDILDAVVGVSGTILVVLAVIGVGGGWLLAGWVLRPLGRINAAARIAAEGHLGHRIRLTGRNDEFRQLADTFDHMLDRLDSAFASQERFAANASHELRTPLTVTETLLDVARHNPAGQDYPTLVERLSITNARAIGLTEALLRLADANAITAKAETADLAVIVRDAVAENAEEAGAMGVVLDVHLEAAPAVGDPHLLAQLAANLIQNAIRHNLTAGGTAWISTGLDRQRSRVVLRVENTGAVYTQEIAARLSEPFLRGGGRVSGAGRTPNGYGLGLALVSRITEVHDGTLAIAPRDGGGLIITLSLPATPMR